MKTNIEETHSHTHSLVKLDYNNCRLTKHIYYPGGVSVTAEKPLIYDKIDNIGGGGVGPVGVAGAVAGVDQCSYQTTVMSTFRHTTDTSSSSAESSCSALCSTNEKHCPTMQVCLIA